MLEALLRASRLPWLEARMLAEQALGLGAAQVAARLREPLAADTAAAFNLLSERRRSGEPMAYILGAREFYGRRFAVSAEVLIPRPETELLCELVLERLSGPDALTGASVLDLGTGSGAIAVTLACERPLWQITAVDVSPGALAVAGGNAQRLCGARSIRFLQSDWFGALGTDQFDVIVSNPPYVADHDPHLKIGDLRFEPAGALRAGADGAACIRAIAAAAPNHLKPGAWLMLEHGATQGALVREVLSGQGLADVFTRKDLAGHERCSGGRRAI